MELLLEYVEQKTLHSFLAWGFRTFVEKQAEVFGDHLVNNVQIDSIDKAPSRSLSHCGISDQLLEVKDAI